MKLKLTELGKQMLGLDISTRLRKRQRHTEGKSKSLSGKQRRRRKARRRMSGASRRINRGGR